MNKLFKISILVAILPLLLLACGKQGARSQPLEQSISSPILQPGETMDGIIITKGIEDATPLWAFCSPGQHSGNTMSSRCNVPILPRLGIGHFFMISNDTLSDLNWSALRWWLSIDNQVVDLEAFGIFEYVMPVISKGHLPVREVFMTFTAWDVVLTNLSPGEHTIHGLAQMGTESYNWIIHLAIQDNGLGTGTPWVGSEYQGTS